MPNFSLAPAIDVLTLGGYPRLPTCIRDRIIPSPSLTLTERLDAFRLLETAIRYRLAHETLPSSLIVTDISKNVVCTHVLFFMHMYCLLFTV